MKKLNTLHVKFKYEQRDIRRRNMENNKELL